MPAMGALNPAATPAAAPAPSSILCRCTDRFEMDETYRDEATPSSTAGPSGPSEFPVPRVATAARVFPRVLGRSSRGEAEGRGNRNVDGCYLVKEGPFSMSLFSRSIPSGPPSLFSRPLTQIKKLGRSLSWENLGGCMYISPILRKETNTTRSLFKRVDQDTPHAESNSVVDGLSRVNRGILYLDNQERRFLSFTSLALILGVTQKHETPMSMPIIQYPWWGKTQQALEELLLLSPPRNPGHLSIYFLRQSPQPGAVRLELQQPHHGHHPQGPEHRDKGADIGGRSAGGNAADEIGVRELLDGAYEGLEDGHFFRGTGATRLGNGSQIRRTRAGLARRRDGRAWS